MNHTRIRMKLRKTAEHHQEQWEIRAQAIPAGGDSFSRDKEMACTNQSLVRRSEPLPKPRVDRDIN